jgi:hypothetical protein
MKRKDVDGSIRRIIEDAVQILARMDWKKKTTE